MFTLPKQTDSFQFTSHGFTDDTPSCRPKLLSNSGRLSNFSQKNPFRRTLLTSVTVFSIVPIKEATSPPSSKVCSLCATIGAGLNDFIRHPKDGELDGVNPFNSSIKVYSSVGPKLSVVRGLVFHILMGCDLNARVCILPR